MKHTEKFNDLNLDICKGKGEMYLKKSYPENVYDVHLKFVFETTKIDSTEIYVDLEKQLKKKLKEFLEEK